MIEFQLRYLVNVFYLTFIFLNLWYRNLIKRPLFSEAKHEKLLKFNTIQCCFIEALRYFPFQTSYFFSWKLHLFDRLTFNMLVAMKMNRALAMSGLKYNTKIICKAPWSLSGRFKSCAPYHSSVITDIYAKWCWYYVYCDLTHFAVCVGYRVDSLFWEMNLLI